MNTAVKNLWRLDKHNSISSLLIMLQHEVEPNGFLLLDEDSLNQKAIRIIPTHKQDELSAYIYSYAQREGHYGLDLEFPYLLKTAADDQTILLNDLSPKEVIGHLISHLELNVIPRDHLA